MESRYGSDPSPSDDIQGRWKTQRKQKCKVFCKHHQSRDCSCTREERFAHNDRISGRNDEPSRKEPSVNRQAANASLIEDQISEENDKYAPALDVPKEKKEKLPFVPTYEVPPLIRVCAIPDMSIFDLLCQAFVDEQLYHFKCEYDNWKLPDFKAPVIDWDVLGEKFIASPMCPTFIKDERTEFRNDMWESATYFDYDEPVKVNLSDSGLIEDPVMEDINVSYSSPSGPVITLVEPDSDIPFIYDPEQQSDSDPSMDVDPPTDFYDPEPRIIKKWGNLHKTVPEFLNDCFDIISPFLSICNPINYLKLYIDSTQYEGLELCAEKLGDVVDFPDTRNVDAREFQPLVKDTFVRFKYFVTANHLVRGPCTFNAEFFPDVSTHPRPSVINRIFFDMPEPEYMTVDVSMNILTELYCAKTSGVYKPCDSLPALHRLFVSNPHNTYLDFGRDRHLDANFKFVARYAQDHWRPILETPKVK